MFCWVCNLTHSKIEVLQWIIIIEKWTDAEGYTPQYPIFSNATGDKGSRFVDLNGDGRMDFVYHLWTPNEVFKGAYINNPELGNFISNVTFAPPIPIAANNGSDLGTSSCFCHIHIILNVCAPVSPPPPPWPVTSQYCGLNLLLVTILSVVCNKAIFYEYLISWQMCNDPINKAKSNLFLPLHE